MKNTTTTTSASASNSSRLRANTYHLQKTHVFQRPVINTSVPSVYSRTRSLTTRSRIESHVRNVLSNAQQYPSHLHHVQSRDNSASSSTSGTQISNKDASRPLSPSESIDILSEHLQSHVLALHDFIPVTHNATCLAFRAGQVIQVLNRDPSGWWDGELEGRRGWFPSNYVSGLDQIGRLRDEVLIELSSGKSTSSLASWTGPDNEQSASISAFPQSHSLTQFPTSGDSELLLSETVPSQVSSPDADDFTSSPTIVRNRAISSAEVSTSIPKVSSAAESVDRGTSPSFSIYNTIASGALSTRSISPTTSTPRQPLLTPLLHAVSLLNRAVAGRRQAHYQPSTACIISCVRSLLMSTECLHRDASVLKRVPALARERKVILSNLATLVAQARRCSEWPGIDEVDQQEDGWQDSVRQAEIEQQDWELEQMLRMGGEVTRNVTQFLEVCQENGVDLPVPRRSSSGSESSPSSRSPSERDAKERIRVDLGVVTPKATSHSRIASGPTSTPNSRTLPLSALRTKSLNDLRAQRRLQHLERSKQAPTRPIPDAPTANNAKENNSISSISSVSSSSISSASAAAPAVSPPFPSGPSSPAQVLSALRTSNDALLSSIAALIGHVHAYGRHSHASSKGHLIELARETVDMVRQLLTIVEAVARHPDISGRGNSLQTSKSALFDATNKLVESVRFITGSESPANKSEDEERQQTLLCATNILRVASDCVAAVKVGLSRSIGDTPFIVCLPVLPLNTSSRNTRVSYLRPRSSSVTEGANVPCDHESDVIAATAVQVETAFAEEDLTLQAVNVSTEGEIEFRSKELSEILSSGSLKSLAESEEDRPSSSASRRSSTTAETTPATSITPEEKDAFEEKLLHGELPSIPTSESPVPPTPSSPCQSSTSEMEKAFANVLAHDYDVRDIAYNSEGAIVGASLAVMIEKITPHDALVDPAFQQIFIMTWRLFVSPSEFVNALVARYNLVPSPTLDEEDLIVWRKRKATPVKLRVANFIKSWLENHWRADTDDAVLTQLSQFVRGTVAVQFPGPAQRILDTIRARTISDDSVLSPRLIDRMPQSAFRDTTSLYTSHLPGSPSEIPRPTITKALFTALKNKNYSTINVTDFDPLELARQFTIRESKLYLLVSPEEVLELGQPGAPSKNLKAISSLSTAVTGWVTECILDEGDAKKRTALVKFFVKVADRCHSLNNFSTLRSILAALDSSTILRLHQTWAAISQKTRLQLDVIRKLADHARNYSEYRSRLRNTCPPAVPFLGLYLTDITFCREGNPSYRVSPRDQMRQLINFNKYHKLARIVQDMQRFQVPFNLKEIPEVQDYLGSQFDRAKKTDDLGELYRRSLLVEPRRPADPSISSASVTSGEGKSQGGTMNIPIFQLWGLSTLSRKEGQMVGAKITAAASGTGTI